VAGSGVGGWRVLVNVLQVIPETNLGSGVFGKGLVCFGGGLVAVVEIDRKEQDRCGSGEDMADSTKMEGEAKAEEDRG
jgi:hypothetical protein